MMHKNNGLLQMTTQNQVKNQQEIIKFVQNLN